MIEIKEFCLAPSFVKVKKKKPQTQLYMVWFCFGSQTSWAELQI